MQTWEEDGKGRMLVGASAGVHRSQGGSSFNLWESCFLICKMGANICLLRL